jgi:hypothetical protein
VLRRHVLAAIAKGVAVGEVDVARRALGGIDWVLRGRARRRLETALIDAALATGVLDADDPGAARHLLRAAGLLVRGDAAHLELADRRNVEIAYDQLAGVTAPRLPVASIAAAAMVLTMATVVVAATLSVEPYPEAYERPAPPPPGGAYRSGGPPTHDPDVEAALTTLGAVERPPVPVASPTEVGRAAPEPVRRAIAGVTAELARFDGEHDRVLRARIGALSDQLVGAGLGYFVDLELRPLQPARPTVYRVEKVTFVRADRERIRVLDVRELGGSSGRTALGMKPEGHSDPIVLLDRIESYVDHDLLPVLDGHRYELADDRWARTPGARGAANAATRAIRRELATAIGARRDAQARIRQLLISSVRHHEAQHGLEQDREVVQPAVLVSQVGPLRDGRGRYDTHALRARNELSAYVSQIASDMWLPQVSLWSLARHAFRPAGARLSPEAIAAVVVLEGLAAELGIASPGSALRGELIDRDRLAALVAPLASVPTIDLRSAAARLWARLFGEPLVRLVDDVFGE